MPPFEETDLLAPAVLWAATGGFDRYGEPAVAAPREISARWVFKRSEAPGPTSTDVQLDATLRTLEELPVGSRVWPGELDEWYGTGSGTGAAAYSEDDVYRVVLCDKTVDIKGRNTLYESGLKKFRRDAGG